jgi:hypothetical protein
MVVSGFSGLFWVAISGNLLFCGFVPGPVFSRAAGNDEKRGAGSTNGVPHRLQKRVSRSVNVFPHFLQVSITGTGNRAPHLLQKTDISSTAGFPQAPHFLVIHGTSENQINPGR